MNLKKLFEELGNVEYISYTKDGYTHCIVNKDYKAETTVQENKPVNKELSYIFEGMLACIPKGRPLSIEHNNLFSNSAAKTRVLLFENLTTKEVKYLIMQKGVIYINDAWRAIFRDFENFNYRHYIRGDKLLKRSHDLGGCTHDIIVKNLSAEVIEYLNLIKGVPIDG